MRLPIDRTQKFTVEFAIIENFTMIAFTSAIEVLRIANFVLDREVFAWRTHTRDGGSCRASNGIALEADRAFRDIGACDALIVCSGNDVQKVDVAPLLPKLRQVAATGTLIGAVCTGTWVLAKAGLLDGYRCTLHWDNQASFREEFPDIEVTEELFELDRNRLTCAGGTAPIDMMLSLVASLLGAEVAMRVTDELIHHRIRNSDERQRMEVGVRLGVSHPKLLAVVAEMERRIEDPIECNELSRLAGMSPRQLERLFKHHIGMTPSRYYRELRLERARNLIRQTKLALTTIALAAGFASQSHFSRTYTTHFAITPSAERAAAKTRPAASQG